MNAEVSKVAIVTGAACGIGYAIAKQLHQTGCRLVINDLDSDALDTACETLNDGDTPCAAVVGDAGDIGVIDQVVETAVARFGRLDWVVANAGITTFGRFLDYTPERFQQLVSLNLQGSFFLAQHAAQGKNCLAG